MWSVLIERCKKIYIYIYFCVTDCLSSFCWQTVSFSHNPNFSSFSYFLISLLVDLHCGFLFCILRIRARPHVSRTEWEFICGLGRSSSTSPAGAVDIIASISNALRGSLSLSLTFFFSFHLVMFVFFFFNPYLFFCCIQFIWTGILPPNTHPPTLFFNGSISSSPLPAHGPWHAHWWQRFAVHRADYAGVRYKA